MALAVNEMPVAVKKLKEAFEEKSMQRELVRRKVDELMANQSAAEVNLEVAVKARAVAQAALETLAYESTQGNDPKARARYESERSPEALGRLLTANALYQVSKERRSAAFGAISDAESQVQWMTVTVDAWKKVISLAKTELSAADRVLEESRRPFNEAFDAWRASERARA